MAVYSKARACLLMLLIVVGGVMCVRGQAVPPPAELLKQAMRQVDLFKQADGPFALEIEFAAQAQQPLQGLMRMRWEAADKWWKKTSVGGYEEIVIQNGEWIYTLRNLEATPMLVRDLYRLVAVADDVSEAKVDKAKQRTVDGRKLNCLEYKSPKSTDSKQIVCIEPASHAVASVKQQLLKDSNGALLDKYADYLSMGVVSYPRLLQMERPGVAVIKARVLRLEPQPFDETLLQQPPGAIARRNCAGLIRPEPVSTPEVDLTGRGLKPAQAVVTVTVSTNGTVSEIHLIGSSNQTLFDEETIKQVKKWLFKPALCGSEPVVNDIVVEVTLHRY